MQDVDGPGGAPWAPKSRATVHCYSYAGPTAGNQKFAARSNAKIGPRCHRFANPSDVVPHAWTQGDLSGIPALYPNAVASKGLLKELVGIVAGLTGKLGYTQIDTLETVPRFGAVDTENPLFFDQFVYQHMEAYLVAFGLAEHGITTQTFFDPLA
jgi:Lipase (class 3)